MAVPVLLALLATATPARGAGELGGAGMGAPVGHVAWTHDDNAFFTNVEALAGSEPSVIVGAGHRNAFYSSCIPGNPSSQINMFRDSSETQEAKLISLDASTGELRWETALSNESGPSSERRRFLFLFQSLLDDIDGDGADDLLAVTGEYDVNRSTTTPVVVSPKPANGRTTVSLLDPDTGALRWEQSWPVTDGRFELLEIKPLSLGDRSLAIAVSNTVNMVGGYTIDSSTRLVAFDPGDPMTEVASLPAEAASLSTASVATGPAGTNLVLSHVRLAEWNGTNHAVDFAAYEVVPEPGGGARLAPRWTQRGAGGMPTGAFPAFITDDADPKLITAQGHDGRQGMLNGVAAYDMVTGKELWRAPVYVGQGLGPLLAADVNGDQVTDAVGGMMGDVAGVPTLPPAPEIVAVDGRTGEILWRRVDAIGKFRPLRLATADLDGDGRPQVVATLVQRDGTTCGSAQDDQGAIGVYDGATGAQQCRLTTDRPVWSMAAVEVQDGEGQILVAPALGGTIYGFQQAEPGCGLLSAGP